MIIPSAVVEAVVEGSLVLGWHDVALLLLLLLLMQSILQENVDSIIRDEEKHTATRQDGLRVKSNPWELKHIRPSNAVLWVLFHEITGSDWLPEKLEAWPRMDQS